MYNGTFLLPPLPCFRGLSLPKKSITCTRLCVSLPCPALPLHSPPSVTTLANFCFLEVSLPRAKGIIFSLSPFHSVFLCSSSSSHFPYENLAVARGEGRGECCGTELGKFLLSLLECFAFWFFRLPQTCSRKPSRASPPPYLSPSLSRYISVSHMKSCSRTFQYLIFYVLFFYRCNFF